MPDSKRLLITAGPTQEPIDAVRYIGNRSSGRLGIALADEAARQGYAVTLLLGPTPLRPVQPTVRVLGYRTTADLQRLLADEFPACDVLIMAAAVADYRPIESAVEDKVRRTDQRLTIELEPTPDLLAECASSRRPGQILIGFALEPEKRLRESAREKVTRKDIDAIVANPLETMDADTVNAVFIRRDGTGEPTPGEMRKQDFAPWLLQHVAKLSG